MQLLLTSTASISPKPQPAYQVFLTLFFLALLFLNLSTYVAGEFILMTSKTPKEWDLVYTLIMNF